MSILTRIMRKVVQRHFNRYPCASYTWYDYEQKHQYIITRDTDTVFFKVQEAHNGE